MTLKDPAQCCDVKLLLGQLLDRFGKDVAERADSTLHMMNPKDEQRIQNWKLANELQIDDPSGSEEAPKRQRIKGSACIANLAEWAEEAEEAEKGIVVVAGTQALAVMSDRITLHAQTIATLNSQLARLEQEGQQLAQEATREKASLLQRIRELEQRLHETPNGQEREQLKEQIYWLEVGHHRHQVGGEGEGREHRQRKQHHA